jgi:ABC-2 type transport system permease protein
MRAVYYVMKKELIQTFRDKRMLVIMFVAPVVQCIIFGFAVNLDMVELPVVIADLDNTTASRKVATALDNSAGFDVVEVLGDRRAVEEAVWKGRISGAVVVPRDYEKKLTDGQAELALILDGSDANTALRAAQEASQILAADPAKRQKQRLKARFAAKGISGDRAVPSVRVEPRVLFNPGLSTAIFLVPGVLALVLLVITVLLTSMGLTREKELGTLEQIMVSPLKSYQLIAGKTLPFALLGLADVMLVVSTAVVIFGVPMRGSIAALFGASTIFLLTTLGLGLFISTVSATQQQAMMSTLFIMLPALMLSGYVFPIEHMPLPAQWLAFANPMTYYIEIVRGLMVKGATVSQMLAPLIKLTAIGALVFALASLRFKKRTA